MQKNNGCAAYTTLYFMRFYSIHNFLSRSKEYKFDNKIYSIFIININYQGSALDQRKCKEGFGTKKRDKKAERHA